MQFYTIDLNLYEKTSLSNFYRKVSMVTPIETKQGTVRSWFDEENYDDETRVHDIDMTDWPGQTVLAELVGLDRPSASFG